MNTSGSVADLLLANVRLVKFEHNKNNPLVADECWVRGDDSSIYTSIRFRNKIVHAHRVSYELYTGNRILNSGCHHCDVKACINPKHIFDGTTRQNNIDAKRKHRVYSISLNHKGLLDQAEKKLRESYPNERVIVNTKDDLFERFRMLVGGK